MVGFRQPTPNSSTRREVRGLPPSCRPTFYFASDLSQLCPHPMLQWLGEMSQAGGLGSPLFRWEKQESCRRRRSMGHGPRAFLSVTWRRESSTPFVLCRLGTSRLWVGGGWGRALSQHLPWKPHPTLPPGSPAPRSPPCGTVSKFCLFQWAIYLFTVESPLGQLSMGDPASVGFTEDPWVQC